MTQRRQIRSCSAGQKMGRRWLVVVFISLLGCRTTGGRVSAGLAGAATGAVVANQFRLLGCDDGDDRCANGVRTIGFVIGGVAIAALIGAIAFEATGSK